MNRSRLPVLVVALLFTASGACAQNFFERLFGITPSRPPPPPVVYPNSGGPPSQLPNPDSLPPDEVRRAPAAPVQARPVAIKAPSEDSVIGRELKQNGTNGTLRIERAGPGDLRLRVTVAGRRAPQSVQTCTVPLGGPAGLQLVAAGRPEGAPRYMAQDPTCPIQIDILDEAVLVKGPTDICVFQDLSCQVDPSGMWGPDASQLVSRARDFEQGRASADKAVRDNYKVLTQRAKPEGIRPIVAEQAAFSADREMMCKTYAREGTTSFCNAKYSEARALSLGARLGLGSATSSTQSAETRSRRSRASQDPYALPSSDELMQRRPSEDD